MKEDWLTLEMADERFFLEYERLKKLLEDGKVDCQYVGKNTQDNLRMSRTDLAEHFFEKSIRRSKQFQSFVTNLGMGLTAAVTYDVVKDLWGQFNEQTAQNPVTSKPSPLPVEANEDRKCAFSKLKHYREKAGLEVADLAEITAISSGSIHALEMHDGAMAERGVRTLWAVLNHPRFLAGAVPKSAIKCR